MTLPAIVPPLVFHTNGRYRARLHVAGITVVSHFADHAQWLEEPPGGKIGLNRESHKHSRIVFEYLLFISIRDIHFLDGSYGFPYADIPQLTVKRHICCKKKTFRPEKFISAGQSRRVSIDRGIIVKHAEIINGVFGQPPFIGLSPYYFIIVIMHDDPVGKVGDHGTAVVGYKLDIRIILKHFSEYQARHGCGRFINPPEKTIYP